MFCHRGSGRGPMRLNCSRFSDARDEHRGWPQRSYAPQSVSERAARSNGGSSRARGSGVVKRRPKDVSTRRGDGGASDIGQARSACRRALLAVAERSPEKPRKVRRRDIEDPEKLCDSHQCHGLDVRPELSGRVRGSGTVR